MNQPTGKVNDMGFQNSLSIALAVTVKQRRGELNMSREELADAMGLPLEIIIDIEDSNPNECLSSKSTLMLLALALRLPVNAFAGYSDSPENEAPNLAPSASKPLILPPMFSRKPSLETPPTIANDNQQKVHIGLEALLSDSPRKRTVSKPNLPTEDALRSPFIPRHSVEKTKAIHLSLDKSRLSQSSIEDLLHPKTPSSTAESQAVTSDKLMPLSIIASSEPVPDEPSSETEAPQQEPVVTRKSYVPSLASRLPFTDPQRETGIFRIADAPEPAPNQKVDVKFGESVPGLSQPSKDFQTENLSESEEKN